MSSVDRWMDVIDGWVQWVEICGVVDGWKDEWKDDGMEWLEMDGRMDGWMGDPQGCVEMNGRVELMGLWDR